MTHIDTAFPRGSKPRKQSFIDEGTIMSELHVLCYAHFNSSLFVFWTYVVCLCVMVILLRAIILGKRFTPFSKVKPRLPLAKR